MHVERKRVRSEQSKFLVLAEIVDQPLEVRSIHSVLRAITSSWIVVVAQVWVCDSPVVVVGQRDAIVGTVGASSNRENTLH